MNSTTEVKILDEILNNTYGIGYDKEPFNPFEYMGNDEDIINYADNLVKKVDSLKGLRIKDLILSAEIYDCKYILGGVKELFRALCLYVFYECTQKRKNFDTLYIILEFSSEHGYTVMDNLFESLRTKDKNHIAVKHYDNFKRTVSNTNCILHPKFIYSFKKYDRNLIADIIDICKSNIQYSFRIFSFCCLPQQVRYNKDVVSKALDSVYENVLEYTSDEIRADEDFILECLKRHNYYSFFYAPLKLKENRDFVLKAVKNNGIALEYANSFTDDRDVVITAIKENGIALQFASSELKADKDVVLTAVKNCGKALKYASYELRDDIEVVMEAVKQNGMALEFASPILKNNNKVVIEAVKNNGGSIEFVSKRFLDDKKIVLIAVKTCAYVLRFVSDRLKDDIDIVRESVKYNPLSLDDASQRIRDNPSLLA